MEQKDIITMYQDLGVVVLFISFLIWQVRYFMRELKEVRAEREQLHAQILRVIENHIKEATERMMQQQQAFELLTQRIDIFTRVRLSNSPKISQSGNQAEKKMDG